MSIEESKRTAEPSPASAGSVAIAWAAVWPDDGCGIDPGWVYHSEEDAMHAASGGDGIDGRRGVGTVVPLYRQPQPALTDAEREAVEWAAAEADQWEDTEPAPHAYAESLRALLERLK